MIILLLGVVALLAGLVLMRNTALNQQLKTEDETTWTTVMRPTELGYVNSFGTIPLFQWVLSKGYEQSSSDAIRALGAASFKRAKTAKSLMILGVVLIFIGFLIAIFITNA